MALDSLDTAPPTQREQSGALPITALLLLVATTPILTEPLLSAMKFYRMDMSAPAHFIFHYGVREQVPVTSLMLCVLGVYFVWICRDRRRIYLFNFIVFGMLGFYLLCLLLTLIAPFIPFEPRCVVEGESVRIRRQVRAASKT